MGKRLRTQRRGRGTPLYRSPSHRHVDDVRLPSMSEGVGTVKDLIQAPGRTCPLAIVEFNGVNDYQLAAEGMKVGQTVTVGGREVRSGNITSLSEIPEGTPVHNVEGVPGDGGKFVKTAGTSATVVSRGEYVVLQMPSGVLKEFHPNCRAAIGIVAGGGRVEKPLGKAGATHWRSGPDPSQLPHQGCGNERCGPPPRRRKPPPRRRTQLPEENRIPRTESRFHR